MAGSGGPGTQHNTDHEQLSEFYYALVLVPCRQRRRTWRPPPSATTLFERNLIDTSHRDATAKLVTALQESMNQNHRQMKQEMRQFPGRQGWDGRDSREEGYGQGTADFDHDMYYVLKSTFFAREGFTSEERDDC